jgi:heme-degrading monooxygenase HmoA
MAFISVTRLRIRSIFYLPQFVWHALKSERQAERSNGFLSGRVMRDKGNAFWTVTAWENEAAMRAYRGAGAHMKAMPKLLDWCDEASIAHWEQPGEELPAWADAHSRMAAEGRMSKVKHPSEAQLAKFIAAPTNGGTEGQTLKRR